MMACLVLLSFVVNEVTAVTAAIHADRETHAEGSVKLSSLCYNQTQQMKKALTKRENWALEMKDADGRPGAGVLLHRLQWWGSYEQCLGTGAPALSSLHPHDPPASSGWMAHYCLASVTLTQFHAESARVGFCFPEGCDDEDVKIYLEQYGGFIGLDELQLTVERINHVTCQARDIHWSSGTVAVLVLLCLLGAVTGWCTVYHVLLADRLHRTAPPRSGPSDLAHLLRDTSGSSSVSEYTMLLQRPITPKPVNTLAVYKLMKCFSLKTSVTHLLRDGHSRPSDAERKDEGQGHEDKPRGVEALSCLHGLRVLSMLWVIQGHTYYYAAKLPSANLKEAWGDAKSGFLFQAVLNSALAGDTFFLVSGLLACYGCFSEMEDNVPRLNFLRFYFRVIWRMTPVYVLVMVLMMFVVPHLGDGPLWSEVSAYSAPCRTHWWTNLLYVNNFLHEDRQCLEWSWFLANYVQFSALVPFLVFIIQAMPSAGVFLCGVVIVGSSTLTGFIATHNHLHINSADFTQIFSQSYRDNYFEKPYCRAPPYFIGFLVGYFLYKNQCQWHIRPVFKVVISLLASTACLLVVFGPQTVGKGAVVGQSTASFYLATSHVMWALCIAWFIIMCCTENAGWVWWVVGWRGWVPLSRLSLCVYFIHPVVILVHFLSYRTPFFITNVSMSIAVVGNTVLSFLSALVIYIGFQCPLEAVKRLLCTHTPHY